MSEHSFTEQVSRQFLNKEWLVKLDNASSRPYLFKFSLSPENQCCVLVTDTVNVWSEVLDSKYLTRRWRTLNGNPPCSFESDEELAWRERILRNLNNLHTPLAIQSSAFSIEESYEADLAIELQPLDSGKWKWECCKLGPKASAQMLSTHLFFPLLSAVNLAFTSADSVSEMSTSDLEEVVDNIAKVGRRTQAVFIRHTLSRPRIATTLMRLSGMLNSTDFIPPILDDYELTIDIDPEASGDVDNHGTSSRSRPETSSISPTATRHLRQEQQASLDTKRKFKPSPSLSPPPQLTKGSEESTTESEVDQDPQLMSTNVSTKTADLTETVDDDGGGQVTSPSASKRLRSSTDRIDKDESRTSLRQTTPSSNVVRSKVSVRQPIKRGGKRF